MKSCSCWFSRHPARGPRGSTRGIQACAGGAGQRSAGRSSSVHCNPARPEPTIPVPTRRAAVRRRFQSIFRVRGIMAGSAPVQSLCLHGEVQAWSSEWTVLDLCSAYRRFERRRAPGRLFLRIWPREDSRNADKKRRMPPSGGLFGGALSEPGSSHQLRLRSHRKRDDRSMRSVIWVAACVVSG